MDISVGNTQKDKVDLPYESHIPLLDLYKRICYPAPQIYGTAMFPVLFTVSRKWKKPKCLSIDDWTMKTKYIYTMKYT